MSELYSKIEMIGAVTEFLQKEGYEVRDAYDPIFEPARVPIFATKVEGKEQKQLFVDIITERKIIFEDYFKKRDFGRSLEGSLTIYNASSAQFFRHYFPLGEVYWAIPSYVDKSKDFTKFCKKCKEENIGLYEVKKVKEGDEVKFFVKGSQGTPSSLLSERIQSIISQMGDDIEDARKDNLTKLLRKYCEEDISYLVFYPEPKYRATDISIRDQEVSISRELISKMGDLRHVSYKDKLINFGKKYFHQAEDDYRTALNITRELWSDYGLELPNLHLDFEGILKLDPRYRDHFLHAFQVFLFGVYVIDSMYSEASGTSFGTDKGNRIEDAWLFAATYHDFNYMVQKFDEWTKAFFQNALHLDKDDESPASLHLSDSFVQKGYMFNAKKLVSMWHIENFDQNALDFFYDRILRKKNHGLISCLSLLKYLDITLGHCLKPLVVDAACKAISMHDSGIWKYLCGMADDDDEDHRGNEFKKKKIITSLSFSNDPIPFLLVLIDSIQEDGRSRDDRLKVELEKMEYKTGKIYCEISFKGHKSDDAFSYKRQELMNVRNFLEGNDKFNITLRNIGDDKKEIIEITI